MADSSERIIDLVVEFYEALFERIFVAPFRSQIGDRLKRNAMRRAIQESADAASRSLTRFVLNERLDERQVTAILTNLEALGDLLQLADIANPNLNAESVAAGLRQRLPCPEVVRSTGQEAAYGLALYLVVRVLMYLGPVIAEWQRLTFSSAFELLRRVVDRLDQISAQLGALGQAGQAATDEGFELHYRDFLVQRFIGIEAGTVRMTTNLNVDLGELFVMPRVMVRPRAKKLGATGAAGMAFMALKQARTALLGDDGEQARSKDKQPRSVTALEQVKRRPRNVIVGAPGSGKSTFLEWLQVRLAAVEEPLVMADKQAIPLLLRVRQLDPLNLPWGAALIQQATGSRELATLMPSGWIERQMAAGRVLVMVDGLDEVDPVLRDDKIIPYLVSLSKRYPRCRYLVSARPVGYPPDSLKALRLAECDLLDFGEPEVAEYARHWCIAVRLARNEPEAEARREGTADGERIVAGFQAHPYIRDLARNPLMLSAICLVNYFEGGHLPHDRAILYRLCVEGLLHHWDQRRGIHSVYSLTEKLHACREVALAMQADDRAEYEAEKVQTIFVSALGDDDRAARLLEHIRYRTGLLLERRPGVFAFAHLTFQEYLAAQAVHEGNRLGITMEQLARDHADGRWDEVIALYCGLTPLPTAQNMIQLLIDQPDTVELGTVLAEAFLATRSRSHQDNDLMGAVLRRIAIAPGGSRFNPLGRFSRKEVSFVANQCVGMTRQSIDSSNAYDWLVINPNHINEDIILSRIMNYANLAACRRDGPPTHSTNATLPRSTGAGRG